jgi:hypothetical protein
MDRAVIAEFTGARRTQVLADMLDFDGPVGVEGFIGGNQVIGVYEGPDRVAFVMGNGTSGYLCQDGTFDYRTSPPASDAGPVLFDLPPVAPHARTTEMIRKEIQSLFALSSSVEVLDWCDPH